VTVELPQRARPDRSVPGGPADRAEALIIKEARRRHRRRLLLTTGVATLVIGGLAAGAVIVAGHRSSAPRSSPRPAHPDHQAPLAPRCRNGQLRVTPLRGGDGMGQIEEVIGFRNPSRASCTMVGFPAVVALDAHGTPVATAQPTLDAIGGIHSGATAPPVVTLGPGQSASATIDGESHPSGSATSCPSYSSFLVTPPGVTRSIHVTSWSGWEPGPFPGCQPIAITPIVPGSSGSIPATPSPVRSPITSVSGSIPATIPAHGASTPTTGP